MGIGHPIKWCLLVITHIFSHAMLSVRLNDIVNQRKKFKCRPIQVSMQYRMHNTQNHGLIDIYSKECSMFNAQRSMANAPKKTTAPKQHWRKRIEIVIWLVINMHTMCLGSLRSAKKPVINANKIHWTHKVTLQTSCATFAIFHFIFLQSFFSCYLLSVVADYSSIMRASALWSRLHSHIDATVETLLRNRFLTALHILHTNPNKKCSSLLAWHTHWKGVEAHKWNKKYEPVVSIEPAQNKNLKDS